MPSRRSIASVPGLGVVWVVTVAHRAGQPEGPNTERMLLLAQSGTATLTPTGPSRNPPDRGAAAATRARWSASATSTSRRPPLATGPDLTNRPPAKPPRLPESVRKRTTPGEGSGRTTMEQERA